LSIAETALNGSYSSGNRHEQSVHFPAPKNWQLDLGVALLKNPP